MELDDSTYSEILKLCDEGDALAEDGNHRSALESYICAWRLLPEPRRDWNVAIRVFAALGDTHFLLGEFDYAFKAMVSAVYSPDGLGNPFIHLRIGQAAFELGDMRRAANELTRAYMGAGREIFIGEDPKYFALLESLLLPPIGRDTL